MSSNSVSIKGSAVGFDRSQRVGSVLSPWQARLENTALPGTGAMNLRINTGATVGSIVQIEGFCFPGSSVPGSAARLSVYSGVISSGGVSNPPASWDRQGTPPPQSATLLNNPTVSNDGTLIAVQYVTNGLRIPAGPLILQLAANTAYLVRLEDFSGLDTLAAICVSLKDA